ncbi:radical SAM/SPASM domain-containing protein [Sporomusa aerivorans]|uniref:radical SAM/SPASM domain-containing protein n=1 Tax=Sporomusa aerivorans TaxID=204936 RepID=UPI00352B845C
MMAQLNAFDMDRELLYEKVPLDTPFNVNIEPTSLCNINCKYCVHSLSTTALQRTGFTLGSMNWNVFQEAVKQMDKFPRKIKKIAFAGLGEPLLHKQLPNMIKEIKKADVAEKTLVDTNALLMTPDIVHELVSSGLDEIKISLQGITNDAYKKTCGAIIDFTNFYKTLKYLYENRGNCCIKIKIADISLDDNEREKFFDLFGNICNYISIEHIYDQFLDVTGESVLNTDHCCNRFGSELRKYSVCSLLFYRINIRWDGSVTLCCPDGLTDKNLHISKIALQDIWNGDIRRNLMKTNLTGKLRNISKCRNCKNVEYLLHQEDVLDGHEKEILQRLGC